MKCDELEHILIQELSGEEVDPDRRKLKEEHLKSCTACRENAAQIQILFSSLEGLKNTPISEPDPSYFSTLLDKTRERIRQEGKEVDILRATRSGLHQDDLWTKIWSYLYVPKPAYAWSLAVLIGVIALSITSLDELSFLHQKNIYSRLAEEMIQSSHESSNMEDNDILLDEIEDLSDDQLDRVIEMLKIEPQISNLGSKS